MLLVCRSYLSDPALIPTVEIVLSKKQKKKKNQYFFLCGSVGFNKVSDEKCKLFCFDCG